MTEDTLAIVDGPLAARAAVHLVSTLLRRAMPADSAADPPAAARRAALRLAGAQLALLRDWEAREPPPGGASSVLALTRWMELSAGFSEEGILDYRGASVTLDAPGRDPLPVLPELKAAIRAWSAEFRDRMEGKAGAQPGDAWAWEHDVEGRRLAAALRRELSRRLDWTVRFEGVGGSVVPVSDRPTERRRRRTPAPEGPAPEWRFGIPPGDAPALVAVHDPAGMRRAMEAFREVLGRWRALRAAEPAYGADDMAGWQATDVLRQHLRAQCEVVLAWTAWLDGGLPASDPDAAPRCALHASRHVEVMEDYSSDGIWTWEGFPADPGERPVSEATKRRLAAWMRLYERARGWDSPDRRPFELDGETFTRMGAAVARTVKRDLPGWDVVFRGRPVETG